VIGATRAAARPRHRRRGRGEGEPPAAAASGTVAYPHAQPDDLYERVPIATGRCHRRDPLARRAARGLICSPSIADVVIDTGSRASRPGATLWQARRAMESPA
jgi:hypothetical protein